MLPVFVLASMTILGLSTMLGVFTNSLIIAVNLVDRAKGKSLSSSDVILVTLGITNIFFQFTMLANDYMSFLGSEAFSDEIYISFTVIMIVPIYASFWFTVCLSVSYCLQIVIFTHPFLIRLKLGVFRMVIWLLMVSVFMSLATGLPAVVNFYRDLPNVNISTNQSLDTSVLKLSVAYLLPSNIVSCSIPLIIVGIANGLIIKSLVTHGNKADRNASGELSQRAEARLRAARTIGGLLIIYMSFFISETLMFVETFPPSSPGFCVCLMIIYIYSPAQSIILILGSPKLKQVSLTLLRLKKEQTRTPEILFITPKLPKTEH